MIVEMKCARGYQIWVDEQKPDVPEEGWEIGEEGGRFETTLKGKPLPIAGRRLEWIDLKMAENDWVVSESSGRPRTAIVKFEGLDPVEATDLAIITSGDPDGVEGPVYITKGRAPGEGVTMGVKLENGDWLELDETMVLIKMEIQLNKEE